jgi:hypothetical protein
MKRIFCYALAGTVLAACSNEEALKEPQTSSANGIRFDLAVGETRGAEATVNTVAQNGFWCKALNSDGSNLWNVSNGTLHFVKDTDGSYVAQMPASAGFEARWPTNGEEISFYASNVDPDNELAMDSSNPPKYVAFTPKNKVTNQIDFIYAANKGTRSDYTNTPVPLTFKHALCKIRIMAKCSSTDYVVKVKGYKLHHVLHSATYNLPAAEQDLTNGLTSTNGTWTDQVCTDRGLDYVSDFYNGYTVSSGISDTGSGDYVVLGEEPQYIGGGEDDGAMLIPYGNYSGYNIDASVGKNKGPYIALLVQVDMADGTPLFPAYAQGSTTDRVSYRGLPDYYGYIYVPYTFSWGAEYQGKCITLVLDLSSGLGKTDPYKTDTVDPTAYDPLADTDLTAENPNPGSTDPFAADTSIFGSAITHTITVADWDTTTYNVGTSGTPDTDSHDIQL